MIPQKYYTTFAPYFFFIICFVQFGILQFFFVHLFAYWFFGFVFFFWCCCCFVFISWSVVLYVKWMFAWCLCVCRWTSVENIQFPLKRVFSSNRFFFCSVQSVNINVNITQIHNKTKKSQKENTRKIKFGRKKSHSLLEL